MNNLNIDAIRRKSMNSILNFSFYQKSGIPEKEGEMASLFTIGLNNTYSTRPRGAADDVVWVGGTLQYQDVSSQTLGDHFR